MTLTDPQATLITNPPSAVIDPDLQAELEAAPSTLSVAVQVEIGAPDASWEGAAAVAVADRSGAVSSDMDLADPDAAGAADAILAEVAADLPATAFLVAGIAAGTGALAYSTDAHAPHGGPQWTAGLRRTLAALRRRGTVMVGLAQENVVDLVDLAAPSSNPVPAAVAALADESRPWDVEPAACLVSVSAWTDVHGRASATGRHVMPLLLAVRDTSLFHPYLSEAAPGRWPGLTEVEHDRVFCCSVAAVVVEGTMPVLRAPVDFHVDRLRPGHPSGSIEFLSLALQALRDVDWAGQFLVDGQRVHRGTVEDSDWGPDWSDDFGTAVDSVTNPFEAMRRVSPVLYPAAWPPGQPLVEVAGDWGDDWGYDFNNAVGTDLTDPAQQFNRDTFEVPKVFALWAMNRDGDVGVVLIGFVEGDAEWHGSFEPRLVGWDDGSWGPDWSDDFDTGQAFRVDRLIGSESDWGADWGDDWGGSGADAVEVKAGLAGATPLLSASVAGTMSDAGDALFLGAVPARSIQVYRLRRE